MANTYSTSDILKGALNKAGEVADGSSRYHSSALKYLNDIYLSVLSGGNEFGVDLGENWVWARAQEPRVLILAAAYTTGTVSLTTGLTTGAFSVAPAASQVGRYLKVDERNTFYKVSAHVAGATSFTLDAAYLETTGTTLAFKVIPLTYDLGAGILRICEPARHYEVFNSVNGVFGEEDGKITGLDMNSFRDNYPRWNIEQGTPTKFARQRHDETQCILEFNRYPLTSMKVEIDVIEIPAGLTDDEDSVPLVPRAYRDALEAGTAHFLCVDKEDEKATYFYNNAKAKLAAMQKQNRKDITNVSKSKGQMYPRQEMTTNSRRLYY